MATIKDVAKAAGVSISTVSHVINGTRFVSESVTQNVYQAIETLQYRPSALARSMKSQKTRTVGMLCDSNANPFFAEVIQAVESTCYQHGYHLVLCNTGSEGASSRVSCPRKQTEYLNTLAEKRVDGLLIMSAQRNAAFYDHVEKLQLPVVVLDGDAAMGYADLVRDDAEHGGYLAAEHLLSQGHRKIGCITGPAQSPTSTGRFLGFQQALLQAGISINSQWVEQGDLCAESGYQAAKSLLKNTDRPTALFVANDVMAMGAIRALHEMGVSVPEHISVVGYDNIELSKYITPALTTIDQPKRQIGELAVRTLIQRIESPGQKPSIHQFQSQIIVRQSVKDIRKVHENSA